jgi:hypothetical protein
VSRPLRKHDADLDSDAQNNKALNIGCILDVMSARRLTIDAIRAGLGWVNQEPGRNRCGCRHVFCCDREPYSWRVPLTPNEKIVDVPMGILLREVQRIRLGREQETAMVAR